MSETVRDPAAQAILDLLDEAAEGSSIAPEAAARLMAARHAPKSAPPDAWRRYLTAVKQQALAMARAGEITILRKGKPADPAKPIKGVIRLAAGRAAAPDAPGPADGT